MGVVSVTELFDEQTGLETVGFQREYTTPYHVEVDDPNDGPQVVVDANGLPVIGNQYTGVGNDVDLAAYCVSLTPSRVPGDRLLWKVIAKWTTIPGPGLGGEGSGSRKVKVKDDGETPTDNPLEFRPDIEVTTAQFTSPVERAKYISGFSAAINQFRAPDSFGPVVNSALTVYDPPLERDDSRMVVRITRYKSAFPWADAEKYKDAVNSDDFTIDKPGIMVRTFKKYTCKLSPITGSYELVNGDHFWNVTYEFHVNNEYPGIGWRVQVVDRGVVVSAREGDPNGRGGTISASDIVAGTPQVRRLVDAGGMPITEPVLLNGSGQPLNPGSPPVYIVYAIYPEHPFAALGM